MLRFLARLSGLLLVAGGFILGVIDGTRSIADSTLELTPLRDTAARLFGERFQAFGPAVARDVHPFLWDPVLVHVLMAPTALYAVLFGLVLLWLGRDPDPGIGFDTKR